MSSNGSDPLPLQHGPSFANTHLPGAPRQSTKAVDETMRTARHAASAHASALCDAIDRNQQELLRLRAQLEGASAVCRVLVDGSSGQEDLDALARAQRILHDIASQPAHGR